MCNSVSFPSEFCFVLVSSFDVVFAFTFCFFLFCFFLFWYFFPIFFFWFLRSGATCHIHRDPFPFLHVLLSLKPKTKREGERAEKGDKSGVVVSLRPSPRSLHFFLFFVVLVVQQIAPLLHCAKCVGPCIFFLALQAQALVQKKWSHHQHKKEGQQEGLGKGCVHILLALGCIILCTWGRVGRGGQ